MPMHASKRASQHQPIFLVSQDHQRILALYQKVPGMLRDHDIRQQVEKHLSYIISLDCMIPPSLPPPLLAFPVQYKSLGPEKRTEKLAICRYEGHNTICAVSDNIPDAVQCLWQ
jgi:hypothetical protein